MIKNNKNNTLILLQSFGFKKNIPNNTNFVFDVRCLKNPYWDEELRNLNGKDTKVINYFKKDKQTADMIKSIHKLLEKWLSAFQELDQKSIVISIGCTGGKHRSVYIAEALYKLLTVKYNNILIKHRNL